MYIDVTQQECRNDSWHFNNSLLSSPVFEEAISEFWNTRIHEQQEYDNLLLWWENAKKKQFKNIAIQQATELCKMERNERKQLERSAASSGSAKDTEITYFQKKN